MGELARKRAARDLRISYSHLWAMGAGTLLLVGISFGLGFSLAHGPESSHAAEPAPLVPGDDDGRLVELLARVEASSRPHGGVEDLTFPDALTGQVAQGPVAPMEGTDVATDPPTPVEPGPATPTLPEGDAAPSGAFTLEVGRFTEAVAAESARDRLREAGLPAWMSVALIEGKPEMRVAIGGYADAETAATALAEIAPAIAEAGGPTPAIAPLP